MTSPAMVIVQARMGSSRFPGKSLAEIDGKPILWHLFHQLSYCRTDIRPILATTCTRQDDVLASYAESQGWNLFRGDENDVLARYHQTAAYFGATSDTVIVRITGDDIWPDPRLVDAAVNLHAAFTGIIDCVFTADDENLPYGVYIDSFTFSALTRAAADAREPYDREHVSPYLRRHRDLFPALEVKLQPALQGTPLSIDLPEDLKRNRALFKALSAQEQPPFSLCVILAASRCATPDR